MTTPTERSRKCRERQALDMTVIHGAIPNKLVIVLVERGYLTDGDSMDAEKRAEALVRFASEMIIKGNGVAHRHLKMS